MAAGFFDGVSSVRKAVTLSLSEDRTWLIVTDDAGHDLQRWAVEDIRQVKDVAGQGLTLLLRGDDMAMRLFVADASDIEMIQAVCPNLNSNDVTAGVLTKVAVWSATALGALALMVFVIVPALAAQLAVFINQEREEAIGRAVLVQIERAMTGLGDGTWFCDDPAGQAAIDKMTARLLQGKDIGYNLQVRAVNDPMLNAFALPGGQIILMNGLIQRADNPEMVAGVLAHELGHVANRDPMEQTLRAAGTAGLLSLVLGDATGGTVIAFVTESILNASYTRAAEARADDFAIAHMNDANLSPGSFAEFFEVLLEDYGDAAEALGWASSHPPSRERADKARGAVHDHAEYSEILTDQEWAALQGMCAVN